MKNQEATDQSGQETTVQPAPFGLKNILSAEPIVDIISEETIFTGGGNFHENKHNYERAGSGTAEDLQ